MKLVLLLVRKQMMLLLGLDNERISYEFDSFE